MSLCMYVATQAPFCACCSAAMASSADASQLGGSSDGTLCMFRIGSFNVGVDQNMLTSRNVSKYVSQVGHIIATCVQDLSLIHI